MILIPLLVIYAVSGVFLLHPNALALCTQPANVSSAEESAPQEGSEEGAKGRWPSRRRGVAGPRQARAAAASAPHRCAHPAGDAGRRVCRKVECAVLRTAGPGLDHGHQLIQGARQT